MRTIETLAREFPDKTGRELFEIQAQDKLEDQNEIRERNQKKLDFAEDLNTNGGFFKGYFGFDQRYMYKVTNVKVDDNGYVTGDVEKIVYHFGHDHKNGKATFNGGVEMSIRFERFVNLENYGILYSDTRCTEQEYDKLKSYIIDTDAVFFHDFINDEVKVYNK